MHEDVWLGHRMDFCLDVCVCVWVFVCLCVCVWVCVATRTWREVVPNSKAPDVRCYHSALVFNNSMYVFGGYTGTQNMNDMQVFNFETKSWDDLPTTGDLPHIRNSHTACMYACMDRGMMFIFGGYNKGQCNADFYECIFRT